jgi:uncharacterized protein involved in exopolysaccharide biosynthesis
MGGCRGGIGRRERRLIDIIQKKVYIIIIVHVRFMNSKNEKNDSEDEISLIDLFAVLWQRKKMIIFITVTAAIGVVLLSIISITLPPENSFLPNVYAPEAIMLIDDSKSSSNNLSSMLNNMSSLASLAGLAIPGESNYSQLAVFLVETNSFLDAVTDEFGMIERLKIKKSPRAQSRKALKKLFKAEFDTDSGTFSISFKDIDPEFARDVVNFSVAYLEKRFSELGLDKNKIEKENLELNIANTYNEILKLEEESRKLGQSVAYGSSYNNFPSITIEMNRLELELEAQKQIYTQLKVQYELNRINIANESPIFQILEYAEVLDQKSGPSRGLICVIVTFAAGFLSVFLAFILNALSNIKNDPQAMEKLRGTNEI